MENLFEGLDSLISEGLTVDTPIEERGEEKNTTLASKVKLGRASTKLKIEESEEEIPSEKNKSKEIKEEESGQEDAENTETNNEVPKEIVKATANLYLEQGIIQDKELLKDFDGTFEDLKEILGKEQTKGAEDLFNEKLETLDPRIKYLIEGVESGANFDDLINIKNNQIKYDSIKEDKLKEDVNLQKQVYSDYLSEKGFSDKKIEKELRRLEDTGELEEESKDALEELKQINSEKEKEFLEISKKEKEIDLKKNKEEVEAINSTIDKSTEIIPGIKLGDIDKKGMKKILNSPVGKDRYGNPINAIQKSFIENPIENNLKMAYLENIGFFKKGGNLDVILPKLKTQITTKITKDIEELSKKTKSGIDNTESSMKITSTKELADEMDKFLKKDKIKK